LGRGIEVHNGYVVIPEGVIASSMALGFPDACAAKARIEIKTGITLTGEVYGLLGGISVEAGATISGLALIDIFISSYVLSAPGSHTFIWCAENGNQAVLRCMAFYIGGTATCTYWLHLSPRDCPGGAWVEAATVSNQFGYIKIRLHNMDKYIPLYNNTP